MLAHLDGQAAVALDHGRADCRPDRNGRKAINGAKMPGSVPWNQEPDAMH
jgi:hypothetical protein